MAIIDDKKLEKAIELISRSYMPENDKEKILDILNPMYYLHLQRGDLGDIIVAEGINKTTLEDLSVQIWNNSGGRYLNYYVSKDKKESIRVSNKKGSK